MGAQFRIERGNCARETFFVFAMFIDKPVVIIVDPVVGGRDDFLCKARKQTGADKWGKACWGLQAQTSVGTCEPVFAIARPHQ